jgi:transcriptional regulator
MYTPLSNHESHPQVLRDLIESYSFGTLVTAGTAGLLATHLPLLLDSDGHRLRGHMARANQQWQRLDEDPVLAIFQGPHAYISPTFYEAEFAVPTWNYVVVHVTGTAHIIDDLASARGRLDELVNHSEEHG